MNIGDMIVIPDDKKEKIHCLVVEIWDFKKYCNEIEINSLEVDYEDAWDNWRERGPLVVALDPSKNKLVKVWSRE